MTQKPIHLFWAVICLLLGAFLGFVTVRNLYTIVRALIVCGWSVVTPQWAWLVASLFPFSFLALYFIWAASNGFARAAGRRTIKPRIGWGALVSGFFIIFFVVYDYFAPGTRALRAYTPEEAAGVMAFKVLIAGLGITLMCWALSRKPSKREPPARR